MFAEAGDQVTYVSCGRRRASAGRLCRRGVVAGPSVFDACTDTEWVPVHSEARAPDRAPEWVKADNIVDVAPIA